MQATPKDFVGRALDVLHQDVLGHLAAEERTVSSRDGRDVAALTRYLLDNLKALFPDETVQPEARSYIHELRAVRNKFAHSDPLDFDDAYRTADTVERILAMLGCGVEGPRSLKRELRSLEAQEAVFPAGRGSAPRPAPGSLSILNIIACGQKKRQRASPAIELYIGSVFQRSLDIARADGLPVLILSTKYGLVDPTTVLQPYELSSQSLVGADRARLIDLLRRQLAPFLDGGLTHAFVLGGRDYLQFVREALENRPVKVEQHRQWRDVVRQVYG